MIRAVLLGTPCPPLPTLAIVVHRLQAAEGDMLAAKLAHHDETRVLQDKLSVYIEKFVLCPACKLPETSYKIKSEIIYHNCLACGAREMCDMQHKLTTYILKQHKIEKKVAACVEINQCVGYRQFFTKSFSVTTWPLWLRRAVRNRHRHAIEQTNAP